MDWGPEGPANSRVGRRGKGRQLFWIGEGAGGKQGKERTDRVLWVKKRTIPGALGWGGRCDEKINKPLWEKNRRWCRLVWRKPWGKDMVQRETSKKGGRPTTTER